MKTISIFGIPVAKVTESEAVERIIAFAKEHHGGNCKTSTNADAPLWVGRAPPRPQGTLPNLSRR